MTVLPMTTRIPHSGDKTPHTGRPTLNLSRHDGARRNLRTILGLGETQHDSPGADVLQRYPTLPDAVFQHVVHNAVEREELLDALHQNGSPTFID